MSLNVWSSFGSSYVMFFSFCVSQYFHITWFRELLFDILMFVAISEIVNLIEARSVWLILHICSKS